MSVAHIQKILALLAIKSVDQKVRSSRKENRFNGQNISGEQCTESESKLGGNESVLLVPNLWFAWYERVLRMRSKA